MHYLDHAVGLCADHRQPVPPDVLDAVLARTRSGGMRVLEAQVLRLRGLLNGDADDLRRALHAFDEMGATRSVARLHVELGSASGDARLLEQGRLEMTGYGEAELPSVVQSLERGSGD